MAVHGAGAVNRDRCTELNSSFMPLAFESFGAVSEDTVKLMARLASKAAELSNIPYSVLLSYYWRKRISTTLQVQNARILIVSAASKDNNNDFYLIIYIPRSYITANF